MPHDTRMAISPQRVIRYTHVWFHMVWFSKLADRMALFRVTSNPR